MGYSLHIEREKPITEAEWREAVSSIDGIKIDDSPIKAINPGTRASINVSANKNDVSVRFGKKGFFGFERKQSWEKCIFFVNGAGSFHATNDIESENNLVHRAAASIAKKLSAKIVGDEG